MDRIRGKVVVITGAARGIGRATAEALLARGARVVIGDRDVHALDACVTELNRAGQISGYPLDVTDAESFAVFLDKARGDGGGAHGADVDPGAGDELEVLGDAPVELQALVHVGIVLMFIGFAGQTYQNDCPGAGQTVNVQKLVGPNAGASSTAYQCGTSLGWGNCGGKVCHYGTHHKSTALDADWGQNLWQEMHFPSTRSASKNAGDFMVESSAYCRSCGGGRRSA